VLFRKKKYVKTKKQLVQISSRLTAFCSLLAFIAGNSRLGPLLAIEGLFAQIHNDLKTTPP